ncbi:hypothetical protein [Limnobacter alexandrii]|uniref:hypothetical protein n=1 Tax=Limnobacter alexandrii TaxID=2570352 RepID=UPI00110846AB|nr:hypothetical protein [Limnobacter alexandrii]
MSDQMQTKTKASGFLSLLALRDFLIVMCIVIFAWKLINSDIQIDMSEFSFSELLALLLSLFSVWLSVAFYFKAGDTSNQFYDNSYKFTKEMSEILGRIEAGFGERLRHLDEGYSGIRDRFDRLPHYSSATGAEVKREEEEIKKREDEQRALLENLATRAKLAEGEKQEIFAKLAEKNEELEQARLELRHLRLRNEDLSPSERELKRMLFRYVAEKIREGTPADAALGSPLVSVNSIFRRIQDGLSSEAIRDLKRFDLLDEEGNLTRDAVMRIRVEMKRI